MYIPAVIPRDVPAKKAPKITEIAKALDLELGKLGFWF